MDTRKNERLIAAGIDTASALERMMGAVSGRSQF